MILCHVLQIKDYGRNGLRNVSLVKGDIKLEVENAERNSQPIVKEELLMNVKEESK
jgi:hypothetical protein